MIPIKCSCELCRRMCAVSVCIPTPDEARALIKAHPKRMARYEFPAGGVVAPATRGREGEILGDTRRGGCTFFDGQNCELHVLRLKPWEGRMAHHDRPVMQVRDSVMRFWRGKRYESVCRALKAALGDAGNADILAGCACQR